MAKVERKQRPWRDICNGQWFMAKDENGQVWLSQKKGNQLFLIDENDSSNTQFLNITDINAPQNIEYVRIVELKIE